MPPRSLRPPLPSCKGEDSVPVPGIPRCEAAGGAEPHVRLCPRGMEPDPGRTARPLAPGAQGHLVRRHRPGADPDEERPRTGVPERGVVGAAPAGAAPPAQGVPGPFEKRARYPRFKSRRSRQSAHYTRSAFAMRGGVLRLAKTDAPLPFVWSWPDVDVTALQPAMVIVSREADGRWYATFTVDADAPEPLEETGHAVGIDLGVKDFAVTSDGERIANPGTSSARPGTWPATSGGSPAASADRRTAPRPGQRSPAPTGRSATPAGTSCTAPAPAWSARPARSSSRT